MGMKVEITEMLGFSMGCGYYVVIYVREPLDAENDFTTNQSKLHVADDL